MLFSLLFSLSFAATPINFFAIADWGGSSTAPDYTTPAQVAVAKAMAESSFAASFVLAVGDNFYEKGIPGDAHSFRFKKSFEDVYSAPGFVELPWYVIAGNHDHDGNVSAEVAYSALSSRWHFPALNYVFTKTAADASFSVEFFLFDSVIMCGDWSNHEPQPLGAKDPLKARSQIDWLAEQMAASTADWLVVVAHYPVYSVAEHGSTECLINAVKPLLEQFGAIYFNGHEHAMEVVQHNGVSYFTVGAAHGVDVNDDKHRGDVPDGSLQFLWPHIHHHEQPKKKTGAYATASFADAKVGMVQYFDEHNTLLYTTKLQNQHTKKR